MEREQTSSGSKISLRCLFLFLHLACKGSKVSALTLCFRRNSGGGLNYGRKNDYMYLDEEMAEKIRQKMPEESRLYDLADLFKIFGDSTRIKILYVLFDNEMCVYDIARILNMTQSAISHQLRALKQNRLVKFRKEGKNVLYSLADEHVFTILRQGMEHVEE